MVDLGTLGSGSHFSYGNGINANGQVAGGANDPNQADSSNPFLYSNGVMANLGTFGGDNGIAFAINTSGKVTGGSAAGTPPGTAHYAFVYSGGVMQNLGTLGAHTTDEAMVLASTITAKLQEFPLLWTQLWNTPFCIAAARCTI